MPPPRRSLARAILFTTLIAGTLDIADALLFYGLRFHVPPARLLQNIASHLLGTSAYSGGFATAFLGLSLHFFIAACWTSAFILAAQRLPWLFRHAIAAGAVYGLLIYGVMTYLVLPHVLLPTRPSYRPFILSNAVLSLVAFMGITVALLNRRFAPLPSAS